MAHEDLKLRTRNFALHIIRLYSSLPLNAEAQIIGKQILRSGTSVGAQYRESQFAKSDADLISKIQGSLQELEETHYWLELITDTGIFPQAKLDPIIKEAGELKAIFITIARKLKENPR